MMDVGIDMKEFTLRGGIKNSMKDVYKKVVY